MMEWIQFVIFCVVVAVIWTWQLKDACAEIRRMHSKIDANRELIHAIHKENVELLKDFHYRLLEIERGRK